MASSICGAHGQESNAAIYRIVPGQAEWREGGRRHGDATRLMLSPAARFFLGCLSATGVRLLLLQRQSRGLQLEVLALLFRTAVAAAHRQSA